MRHWLRALSFMLVTMVTMPALAAEAGHVLRLEGAVEIERASGTTSLGVGQPIATGDRIKTGEDARVEIELEGGVRLVLGPDSQLVVPEQASRTISVVDLLMGIVRATLPDEGVGGFMVRGRTAVASVRSTEWIVETDDTSTAVFSISSEVQVIGTGGSVVLMPGQGTDVDAGSAPTEPKEWGAERRSDVVFRTQFP
jgi:ferric-dicitrate binding protein FerR (iron transport regulator)